MSFSRGRELLSASFLLRRVSSLTTGYLVVDIRPQSNNVLFFEFFRFDSNSLLLRFELFFVSIFVFLSPALFNSKVGWFWFWSHIPKPPGPRGGDASARPAPRTSNVFAPLPIHFDNFDSAIPRNRTIQSIQDKHRITPHPT